MTRHVPTTALSPELLTEDEAKAVYPALVADAQPTKPAPPVRTKTGRLQRRAVANVRYSEQLSDADFTRMVELEMSQEEYMAYKQRKQNTRYICLPDAASSCAGTIPTRAAQGCQG